MLLLVVLIAISISTVESDWLFVPNSGAPPSLYFNATKLGAWSSTVDYIEVCQFETMSCLNKASNVHGYFYSVQILLHV